MKLQLLKTLLVSATVFLFFLPGHSQLGLKAGVNFSDVSIETSSETFDGKTGFHLGVFLDIGLADVIALRPGVIYNTKGFSVGGVDNTLNYFDIPLNAALMIGNGPGKFVIEAGPYFGLFIDGDADGMSLEGGDDINSTELGYNGGVGYETDHFGLGLNYKRALTDIDPMDGPESFSAKNNIFSVFLVFKL